MRKKNGLATKELQFNFGEVNKFPSLAGTKCSGWDSMLWLPFLHLICLFRFKVFRTAFLTTGMHNICFSGVLILLEDSRCQPKANILSPTIQEKVLVL